MPVKRLLFLILILALTNKAHSQQQTADIGLFVGGGTPISDLTITNIGQSVKLNYGGFYRHNFNSRYGLRFNGIYGTIAATGELAETTLSFSKKALDLSAMFEINYLDFLLGVKKWKYSPYVHYGLGLMYHTGDGGSSLSPSIIVGTGIKYALSDRWGISAEASARKLTTDGLDNLIDPFSIGANDWMHNNDWAIYYGVSFIYKIYLGKKPCPAYNSLN